ncbi:MAG TPA: cytochrome c3 family protein [Polyangiales bacterium]|nr:cytochrome c3 family protein [Polyangiales bacterium]
MRARPLTLASLLLLSACGRDGSRSDTVQLRIPARAGAPLSAAAIRYLPDSNVRTARLSPTGWLSIERRDSGLALDVDVAEYCPATIPAGPQRQPLELRPRLDFGAERPPLGFGAPVRIAVGHGCPDRGRGTIAWRQIEGAKLDQLVVSRDGFELTAHMPRYADVAGEPAREGLLPVSPRTQGRVVLEAVWQAAGLPPIRRELVLRATSRATGLASVAVSQQLLIGGDGWRVADAPQNGHAQVHPGAPVSIFTPDAPGRWSLENARGRTLTLSAFWHDKTPYDCGRSECHASIAAQTAQSRMSHALEDLLGTHEPAAVGCRSECHVLGEPGVDDGGFADVASELGWSWLDGAGWQDLPQSLRRLGGVRCTACHGPGAIPEPDSRAHVLRSDVCATCHDAPPRYVHVVQWRASRMSRSDALPSTRTGTCVRCHTTAGFLNSIGAGPIRELEPTGIACAACHAPHASHRGARLIRSVETPLLGQLESQTAICVPCHSPAADELHPSASSASLWSGRARLPAADGGGWDVLEASAPHRAVPGGCVGCHGGRPKVEHSFRADADGCKICHDATPAAPLDVRTRALAAMRALEDLCPSGRADPPHAALELATCRTPRWIRASYAAALVLEDPAAAIHNAVFARALLADAERQIDRLSTP